jgi:hypothetical protein
LKKEIAKQLNDIADGIPHVFIEQDDHVLMIGHEVLLTPLAHLVIDPNLLYSVYIPKFVAVDHKQQIKDCWKREGMKGVTDYCKNVLRQLRFTEEDIEELFKSKAQELKERQEQQN